MHVKIKEKTNTSMIYYSHFVLPDNTNIRKSCRYVPIRNVTSEISVILVRFWYYAIQVHSVNSILHLQYTYTVHNIQYPSQKHPSSRDHITDSLFETETVWQVDEPCRYIYSPVMHSMWGCRDDEYICVLHLNVTYRSVQPWSNHIHILSIPPSCHDYYSLVLGSCIYATTLPVDNA